MTEAKVTNYQLSKRLNELNFDSKTNCGWVIDLGNNKSIWTATDPSLYPKCESKFYKSYDCHDLLMWLQEQEREYLSNGLAFRGGIYMLDYWDKNGKSIGIGAQPQNALASAIIRILEENSRERRK